MNLRKPRCLNTLSNAVTVLSLVFALQWSAAQTTPAPESDTIRGTVLNSVMHEPVAGALVASPDNRFAVRTDAQGHFELLVPKPETTHVPDRTTVGLEGIEGPNANESERAGASEFRMPVMLVARKPGFLQNENLSALDLAQHAREVTLYLVPEAVIAGHVSLPSSEAPEKVSLQLFRRVVQNGVPQWLPAGNAVSRTNGDFRFADLAPGTYKLLTQESLDRDPLNPVSRSQQYGYPPVYYPDAGDFASASELTLSAGETVTPTLELVKQPYYRVSIALGNAPPPDYGINVSVFSQKGHAGPGYTLGYDPSTQKIEGLLPNGTYTVEARSYGPNPAAGSMTLVVKGAPAMDAKLDFAPTSSVVIDVKEEFTGKGPEGATTYLQNGRTVQVHGPRRYLNVFLEPADEFGQAQGGFLAPPSGAGGRSLEIHDVAPGRYWVRMQSMHGYVASMRSGSTNLLREPLVVSPGGASIPIDVVMRDDTGEIAGRIEELVAAPVALTRGMPRAIVYCVPTPDSTGQLAEAGVTSDGTFSSPPLAPGEYRVLAFDREHTGLEYRNPEAMKAYESKGPVVQVAAGQTEQVTLQLSSTPE